MLNIEEKSKRKISATIKSKPAPEESENGIKDSFYSKAKRYIGALDLGDDSSDMSENKKKYLEGFGQNHIL